MSRRIMARPLAASAACFGAALGTICEAQVVSPDSMAPFYSNQTTYTGAAVWEAVEQLGRCEAHRNRAGAATFLGTAPGSPAEQAAFKALFGNNVSCLGDLNEMHVPRFAIRGALAEALYKVENGKGASQAEAQVQPAAGSGSNGFAECYVHAHPAQVRFLLMSTAASSKREHDAMVAMAPDFSPCLPAGQQLRFTPTILRFAFAQALYTMSLDAAPWSRPSAHAAEQRH